MKSKKIGLILHVLLFPAVLIGQDRDIATELKQDFLVNVKLDYQYLLRFPIDYTGEEPLPLLIFLHGSGERGDSLGLVRVHGPWKFLEANPQFRFALLAPQCRSGEYWNAQKLDLLVDQVISSYSIDTSRIYLTGLSMGGYGTWDLAIYDPERFAAIAPVCGSSNLHTFQANKLVDVPVWVFHGAMDEAVPLDYSSKLVNKLKGLGAKDLQFTIYPFAGHDAWTETYLSPELYRWFLDHKKE